MRDLGSNNSDINPFDFYNATFEDLFNSNDVDGDLVPDSDEGVRELLDWIMIGDGTQVPNMVSNFVYYDEELDYIDNILTRVTLPASISLAFIAILPFLFRVYGNVDWGVAYFFVGTIIITVSYKHLTLPTKMIV